MGMRTLPREPWRGSQICGYQIAYGLPWSIFCGELKKPGSPWCEGHDREERADNYGVLPSVAEDVALGLPETVQGDGVLSWETEDPDTPRYATEEEVAAWRTS